MDSEKIRRKALGDCSRARTTFQKAEAELATYEAEDIPAYTRWYRVTFGPELEALREIREEAEALSQTLWRLEQYHTLQQCSFREAAEFFEQDPKGFSAKEAKLLEKLRREQEEEMREMEEIRKAFVKGLLKPLRQFLNRIRNDIQRLRRMKLAPDQLLNEVLFTFAEDEGLFNHEIALLIRDERVQALLREFKLVPDQYADQYADEEPPEPEASSQSRRNAKHPKSNPGHPNSGDLEDARIKALKRELAFALHPDQEGKGDPQKLELWHQVQDAVAARDVDRLEVIQAHLHMLTGEVSGKTPVSRLHALTAMYRESRNALRRRIRKLRQAPEWGFQEIDDKNKELLRSRLKADVTDELRRAKSTLRNVKAEYQELKTRSEERLFDDPYDDTVSLLDLFGF